MSKKGMKMSLGEFIGDAKAPGSSLPTAPKERAPDDEGRFQRHSTRHEDRPDYEPSRSESDNSWRRGGGGPSAGDRGGARGGFGDRGGDRGGFGDRGGDRGGYGDRGGDRGGYGDRGGGSGDRYGDRGGDRGGYGDRGGDRGGYGDRGGDRGGYGDRGGDRGGYGDRGGGSGDRYGDREERGGDNWRGGGGGDRGALRNERYGDRGDSDSERLGGGWRGGNSGSRLSNRDEAVPPPSTGERPRLQLKARTSPLPIVASPTGANPRPVKTASITETKSVAEMSDTLANVDIQDTPTPEKIEPDEKPEVSTETQEENKGREEKQEMRRREPKTVNSRAAAFGLAPDARRGTDSRRERTPPPPPVANSRFAQLADEEREKNRDFRRQGPPPTTNSRFAAAAEADRSYREDREVEQGPPPQKTNTRFAAAAAMAEEEERDRQERRAERDSFFNRDREQDDRRGPAPQQNSRFAAAAAMDEDYVDREERQRRTEERDLDRQNGGGGRSGYEERGHGFRSDDRGPKQNVGNHDNHFSQRQEEKKSSVADQFKPKAPPVEDNILKVPMKELAPQHADNVLQFPTKPKTEDNIKMKPEAMPVLAEPEPQVPSLSDADTEKLLKTFTSGNKQGEELKEWIEEQRAVLPSVEQLVFHFLTEHEKLNPDPDCGWAEPDKFGLAFVALVEDDIVNQMQLLWGIQFYCDKLGFPKLNDEYVIQSMFRAAYKYDLAEDDAYFEWKEDESEEHERGKMKAIIQTVDWFNWLEQDEEEGSENDDE